VEENLFVVYCQRRGRELDECREHIYALYAREKKQIVKEVGKRTKATCSVKGENKNWLNQYPIGRLN
jgi:hypothetical protein